MMRMRCCINEKELRNEIYINGVKLCIKERCDEIEEISKQLPFYERGHVHDLLLEIICLCDMR